MADLKNICIDGVVPNVPAQTPVDLRKKMRGQIKVCFMAAADVVVEVADASVDDKCVPSEEWLPYQVTDVCGDMSKSDCILSVTAEDLPEGGKCCFIIAPCADYVRFSADAQVVGIKASNGRGLETVGCGPDVNPNDNLPA